MGGRCYTSISYCRQSYYLGNQYLISSRGVIFKPTLESASAALDINYSYVGLCWTQNFLLYLKGGTSPVKGGKGRKETQETLVTLAISGNGVSPR